MELRDRIIAAIKELDESNLCRNKWFTRDHEGNVCKTCVMGAILIKVGMWPTGGEIATRMEDLDDGTHDQLDLEDMALERLLENAAKELFGSSLFEDIYYSWDRINAPLETVQAEMLEYF